MKIVTKRIYALVLAVVMVVTGILVNYTPADDVYADETTKVTFHYHRDDGNYDGWDVYTWGINPSGATGAAAFTGEDEFGKIAVLEVAGSYTELGFLVRQGGDDWVSKDVEEDRTVTVTNGVAEIWITSGVAQYETEQPEVGGSDAGNQEGSGDANLAPSTLVIHYQRADEEYGALGIWSWPDGADGKRFEFDYEDSWGKVAVVKYNQPYETLGFIVTTEDWQKDEFGSDRTVTLTDGFAEIWVTSGVEEFATSAPDGAEAFDLSQASGGGASEETPIEGDLTVTLHYHRYDGNYTGWNVWIWPEGKDGAQYEFAETDDFGVICKFGMEATANIGFIVKLNGWDKKDCGGDRFIPTSHAVDGNLEVWLVEEDQTIYYDINDVDLSPKFLGASFETTKRINVKVTMPVDTALENAKDDFKVVDQDGNEYEIMNVFSTGESAVTSKFNINMQEPLNLGKSYKIVSETYGEIEVAYGAVFSTLEFEQQYTYDGDDLGATYSADSTTFKVWSPTASNISLKLYENGTDGDAYKVIPMTKGDRGVWSVTVEGDLNKVYYTYAITNSGVEKEAVDLYARTTGVNGKRGMVIDLDTTDPEGWSDDKRPTGINSSSDAVIYELHIRDFTIDESSGVTNKGKYLGLTEKGTKNATGQSTALDHIVALGVTHVQILPMYDFSPNSVNEAKLDQAQFNWGYDPYNYNVPEGSYSTDPFNGEVRIKEMKQMIQAFHKENIGVIMDVVYNHTAETAGSYFNITVPDYYYRLNEDGGYSNGSGCGNEAASERAMVRKYIVDSVVYWATEYHIDGFRFDLMGVLDQETMNEVRAALYEVDPSIIVYGEGWTGGGTALSQSLRAMKESVHLMEGVGAFSDDIRDGIKGSVFEAGDRGFATGKEGQEERIKAGVVGATDYPGIDWGATGTDIQKPWTSSPSQAINYVSAHDNLTLWDKINSSNPDDTLEDRIKMNKLSASIVYTAQGTPFMLSGEEILRTKPKSSGSGFDENSYKSPDSTNSIKWDTLNDENVQDVLAYYQGLIAFRKNHAGLRMSSAEDVKNNLKFIEAGSANVVGFVIENKPNGECSDSICVIYNANKEAVKVAIPEGEWKVCIKDGKAGTEVLETFTGKEVEVAPISCIVMVQGTVNPEIDNAAGGLGVWGIVAIAAGVLLVAAIALFLVKSKKKNASA